jgi:hypothetical protein
MLHIQLNLSNFKFSKSKNNFSGLKESFFSCGKFTKMLKLSCVNNISAYCASSGKFSDANRINCYQSQLQCLVLYRGGQMHAGCKIVRRTYKKGTNLHRWAPLVNFLSPLSAIRYR